MKPIKLTRDMFPDLPDEIWEMFIVPQNESPLNIFDSRPGGRWFYHFAGLSIDAFNHLRWRLTVFTFKEAIFHPFSGRDVDALIHYHSLDKNSIARTLYQGYPEDSYARFAWHKEFIMTTGRLCAPIVAIRTDDGIRFLDGCHRLAAAATLDNHDEIPLDAWMGE